MKLKTAACGAPTYRIRPTSTELAIVLRVKSSDQKNLVGGIYFDGSFSSKSYYYCSLEQNRLT